MSAAAQIAEALGARPNGHGWMARCVAHEDSTPSLSISEGENGTVLVKCHAGCTQAAVIAGLRALGLWPATNGADAGGLTVAELAIAKGLPEPLLRESGFSDDTVKGYPVVRIEYRDAARVVICTRYRGRIAKDGGARFWFHKGDKQQLFGLWRLRGAEPVIVVEGETDAMALWNAGFNAVGVPGAKAWSDKRFAPVLKDCQTLFVHVEPDEGGEQFRAAFERSTLHECVKFFTCASQAAKDPCELRARDSAGFRAAIQALLREAGAAVQPGSAAEELPPGAIEVRAGELPRLVREAEDALLQRGGIYQRAQQLVHIVELDRFTESKEGIKRDAGSLMIMRVERDRMRLELANAANWVQYDGRKKKWRSTDPPGTTIGSLLCNVGAWKLPPLTGIIAAPTLRRDGSLLAAPGYDPDSGLYGAFDPGAFPPINPTPTREDALTALALLKDLYSECAFEREHRQANESVAIAATLTAAIRHALSIAPMFVINAHKRSSGKTTIARVIHQIVTGQREPPVTGLSENEAELRKKILAILIAGDPVVRIDNITEPIDSATLCAVITSPTYRDRILGVSEQVSVSTEVTWIATGNNLSLVGDLTSRALLCTLDPEMELPEERTFKRDILKHVGEHRGALLAAALSIPLAFLTAGAPATSAPDTRFPEWDRLVRRPMLWLGCADPLTTQVDLRDEDPERGHLISVLHAVHAAFQEETFTAADIMRKAGPKVSGQSLYSELQQAFADTDVAGDKIGNISPRRVGRYLQHYAGRIESDLRIQKAGKDRVTHRHRFRVTPPDYGVSGVSGVFSSPSRINQGEDPNLENCNSDERAAAKADNADNAGTPDQEAADDIPF